MKPGKTKYAILALLALAVLNVSGDDGSDGDGMKITVANQCLKEEVVITLTGKRDKPLEDADMDIYYRDRKIAYGKTNDEGIFKFKAEKEGINQLKAKKSGYNDLEYELNITECAKATTTSTSTMPAPTTRAAATSTSATITTKALTTTTTRAVCNNDHTCEGDENYANCPGDCPSGSQDSYCDSMEDGICDMDCYRKSDPDCLCNSDGKCEPGFETSINCPADCKPGTKEDEFCDGADDGVCDPDCETEEKDPDCRELEPGTLAYPLIAIIILFGAVTAYGMKREVKKRNMEQSNDELVETLKKRLKEGEDPAILEKELIAGGKDTSLLRKAESRLWE
ncbi:MAG: hypothetical protein JW724_05735 [Candidatus Altiarchaeota archaeon]|nr:hypothetical protein [Candidatus Altiarchaeota archaeon]